MLVSRRLKVTPSIFVACFALLAVSCGSDAEETAPTTTLAPTTTTTTQAPTTTTTTQAPTTTTEVDLGPVYPLTGEPIGDAEDPDHPAVVVKISNNDATARAVLRGIDAADIIFEERIEQQATRFATVFHSELPEEVGSVRSARTSDINIVANLNNPVFAFSGANNGVTAQVRQAQGNGILTFASEDSGSRQFSLIGGYNRPNKTVVTVLGLVDVAGDDASPPTPIYDYSDNVAELGTPSPGVRISAASAASFVWSPEDGGYLRFQGSQPHVTRDDVQITPQNVIVMTTRYLRSQIDTSSVDAITIDTQPVVVYSNGHRVEGTWTREAPEDGYTLTTADGDIIGLAPGQTWVSMTPPDTSTELTPDQIDALL